MNDKLTARGPFKAAMGKNLTGNQYVQDASGKGVANVFGNSPAEGQANAEQVATILNSHTQLLEACKAALPLLKSYDSYRSCQAEKIQMGYMGMPELEVLQAAIAAAEGAGNEQNPNG